MKILFRDSNCKKMKRNNKTFLDKVPVFDAESICRECTSLTEENFRKFFKKTNADAYSSAALDSLIDISTLELLTKIEMEKIIVEDTAERILRSKSAEVAELLGEIRQELLLQKYIETELTKLKIKLAGDEVSSNEKEILD